MANAGIMSESSFAGKTVVLEWLNSNLQLRLDRIEDVRPRCTPRASPEPRPSFAASPAPPKRAARALSG
jgi:hypothetical protein